MTAISQSVLEESLVVPFSLYSADDSLSRKADKLLGLVAQKCPVLLIKSYARQQFAKLWKEGSDPREVLDKIMSSRGLRVQLTNLVSKLHVVALRRQPRIPHCFLPADVRQAMTASSIVVEHRGVGGGVGVSAAGGGGAIVAASASGGTSGGGARGGPGWNGAACSSEYESLDVIREARERWEDSINEELMAISREFDQPFVRAKQKSAQPIFTPQAKSKLRFLFDTEDLLETIMHIETPNRLYTLPHDDKSMFVIKTELPTPTLQELRRRFADLAPIHAQYGVDDREVSRSAAYTQQRLSQGRDVIAQGLISEACIYARRGVPPSLRPMLWRVILGMSPTISEGERLAFAALEESLEQYEYLVDELVRMDVDHLVDDDKFFPFQETLEQCMLAFSRDPWVRQHAEYRVHKPLLGVDVQLPPGTCMPPSGVQPFLGLVNYLGPICYLCDDAAGIYSIQRSMWCVLWCRLNVISSQENTLLSLCKTFESLLWSVHPRLVTHLLRIGSSPLQIAMPWIQFGFVGFLEMDQVLLLWDRLLGFQDATILAVLAAAVFVFRAEMLLTCNDDGEVQDVMGEGNRLKAATLVQMMLFPVSET